MPNHIQSAGNLKSLAKASALGKGVVTCMNLSKSMISHVEVAEGVRLKCGRIHEVSGPASDVFAMLVSAKRESEIMWIGLNREIRSLCATGIERYVSTDRIILVETVSRDEALWTTEQALRATGGFTVILDLPNTLSLKESRRFQLAAEHGGGIGLVLIKGSANNSAAQTRWFCKQLPDKNDTWEWDCLKGKNGEFGKWHVHYQGGVNATDIVHMATATSA